MEIREGSGRSQICVSRGVAGGRTAEGLHKSIDLIIEEIYEIELGCQTQMELRFIARIEAFLKWVGKP